MEYYSLLKDVLPFGSTVIGAIIGAAGAIYGGRITAVTSFKQRKASTAVALLAEIEVIKSALADSLLKRTDNPGPGWVAFFAKSQPAAMCPFYSNAAVEMGALDQALLTQVVKFYTSFLTIETIGHLDEDGGSRWIVSEEDVRELIVLAEAPCEGLRSLIVSRG